ncbi:ribonuclease H-like domain-containing protein [Daedaleopsis nitida]|nr:ribonuclease H-like domain-containing protein [Daedaleopsis nitida]
MSAKVPNYTLVSRYEEVPAAVEALSQHQTMILDCEGKNLGLPGGIMSIFSLADADASHIYVFDALALDDKHHALMSPIFSLLRNSKIRKLVWDGRAPFMELAEAYGVLVDGVFDVQLAEVMQRPPHDRHGTLRGKLTADYFKRCQGVMEDFASDPAVLDGIHRAISLEHCAGIMGILKDLGMKQESLDASADDKWRKRPLSPLLLKHAVRDVFLVSHVHFQLEKHTPPVRRVGSKKIRAASTRYLRAYPTRELKELHVTLELSKFVPLDVLEVLDFKAQRYKCARCERMLSLSCFFTREITRELDGEFVESLNRSGSRVQRMRSCRLCFLIARRQTSNREVALQDWVLIL